MAFGHRTRQGAIVRPTKRQMVWFGIDIDPTALPADGTILLGSLTASALLFRPFTVVRTHLLIHVQSDQEVASETYIGALGMIVSSDQATGATLPVPIANVDADFFLWEPWIGAFNLVSGVGYTEPTGYVSKVDSKAMRKVGPNQDIRVMAESASPTAGQIVSVLGRMLVKLH